MEELKEGYRVEWIADEVRSRIFKTLREAKAFAREIVDKDIWGEITIDEIKTLNFEGIGTEIVWGREWLYFGEDFERI